MGVKRIMKLKKLAAFLTALSATTISQAQNATYFNNSEVLFIPDVVVNGKVKYANVQLGRNSDGTFTVLHSESPKFSATYDPATSIATIPEVVINGKVEFVNAQLEAISEGKFSVLSTDTPPVSNKLSCSIYADAAGTRYCMDGNHYPTCLPDRSKINKLQIGMAYDEAVKILGCHGYLGDITAGGAKYSWGTKEYHAWGSNELPVASVYFDKGKVVNFSAY